MEINIKLMTEQAYKTLQKDFEGVYKMILEHPTDATWLKDYLGFEPYETKSYVVEDFDLKTSDNYDDVYLENSIALYEHLNTLPKYILSNTRFWAWITFEKAYKQAILSLPLKSNAIIKNWWLPGNSRRDNMLQVIGRHYYKVEVSVNESNANKYDLTNYVIENSEAYRNIVFRNIGMIKNVSLALLKVERDIEEEYGFKFTNDSFREAMKEASKIGSVMLIDVISMEEIYNILKIKLLKIYNL